MDDYAEVSTIEQKFAPSSLYKWLHNPPSVVEQKKPSWIFQYALGLQGGSIYLSTGMIYFCFGNQMD